jgi:hypothetical protein
VRHPLKSGEVSQQELATPQGAVTAETRPVEGHSQHWTSRTVVGQAGGDVRVMVLDSHEFHVSEIDGVFGRQVFRVQVVRHNLGRHVEKAPEVRYTVGERPQCLVVLQVADVVGQERVASTGQAEGALEFSAAAQDREGHRLREGQRLGRVAAGSAHRQFGATEHPHYRVIGAHVDRAVVRQIRIRDSRQPPPRVLILVGNRLIGDVSAGEHDGLGGIAEQQVMQRGIGQHQTQVAVARCDSRSDRSVRTPR